MSATKHSPVLIIGSGPAGYTAGIYTARAMLEPVLVAGMEQGGQLTITTDVENYPGYAEPVMGPWMMEQMLEQAKNVGTEVINDVITEVDLDARPFRAIGDSGTVYTADALIIATGAQAKWLGIDSEKTYMGYGVSACATCDGFFYRGKDVIVVGGGNSAVEESLYLANLAKSVTLVHRRDELRSEKILQERLFAKENVTIMWDTVIDEILGAKNNPALPAAVTGARLKNVKTGETSHLAVDGVFIAIGHSPNTAIFKGKLDMDGEGYLITAPDSTRTNVPGIFAAGDVRHGVMRRVASAVGQGSTAINFVHEYLKSV